MNVLGNLIQRLRTWLGVAEPARPATAALPAAAVPAFVAVLQDAFAPTEATTAVIPGERFAETIPAVAGFSHRIEKVDHMLAARLHSVARLNKRADRVASPKSSSALKTVAVPKARIGAKTTRAAQGGHRVLKAAVRPTAQIIQFPLRQQVEISAGDLPVAA